MIVPAIPFDRAVYCADCHLVVECVAHRCPICQRTAVVNLARMVEGDPLGLAHTKLLERKS